MKKILMTAFGGIPQKAVIILIFNRDVAIKQSPDSFNKNNQKE